MMISLPDTKMMFNPFTLILLLGCSLHVLGEVCVLSREYVLAYRDTCNYNSKSIGVAPVVPEWTVYLRLENNVLEDSMINTSHLQSSMVDYIRADYNNIQTIPLIPRLKFLSLKYNQIGELDMQFISQFTSLQYLYLDYNKISTLNGTLTTIPNLIKLTLESNKITLVDLSYFEMTPALTTLNFNRNPISSITGDLVNVTQLIDLFLNYNYILNAIDLSTFGGAKVNRKLQLKYGNIKNIKCSQPCALNDIYYIEMKYQKIAVLDFSVFYSSSKLGNLNLQRNQIQTVLKLNESIPSSVPRQLHLEHNQLVTLNMADFEYIGNLKYLYASYNLITSILPSSIPMEKLYLFALSYNRLTHLNLSLFENTSALYTLDVYRNSITNITCPDNLISLAYLNMTHNKLSYIDFSCFNTAPNLYILKMDYNLLSQAKQPTSALPRLAYLYLRYNQFTYINYEWFTNMPNLLSIYLGGNKITYMIPATEYTFSKLSYLYLDNNPIQTLQMSVFQAMINLRKIYVRYNQISEVTIGNLTLENTIPAVDMYGNKVSHLDFNWFQNLRKLSIIDATKNQVLNVTSSKTNMTSVTQVILVDNKLMEFKVNWFRNMPNLELINCSTNQIENITGSALAMNSLLDIILSNNKLKYIDTSFFDNMPKLKRLDLRYNYITRIVPEYCQLRFNSLTSGFKLYLDSNPLSCDEDLQWLKTCQYTLDFSNTLEPICAEPERVTNRYLYTLTANEFGPDECESNPCQHGATCTDLQNSYTCECVAGYTSGHCETDIDECASSPCSYGNCTDGQNSYVCDCSPGYTDRLCQTEIDECSSNPCENNATCVDAVNNYTCQCQSGFTGTHCQSEINECSSNPCVNRGNCTDHLNAYSCTCGPGFTGLSCETDIDECSSNPCLNAGTCSDHVNGYQCTCVDGFTGSHCVTDIDECSSNPCLNAGTCSDGVNGYQCTCVDGFTGSNCETDINECSSNPCLNEGTCSDYINGYQCTCVDGFTGTHCETDIDECSSDPCLNVGTCSHHVNGYQCTCVDGFTGSNCETDIDECSSNPCLNAGTCSDHINGYQCTCVIGFTGSKCETDIDECLSNPCLNEGTCADHVNGYSCICADGFSGVHCETDINECSSDPCLNVGTCSDKVNGYQCTCVEGYTGSHCETDIDECSSNPCLNAGTCSDHVNGYQCTCVIGFTGSNCETDIDECLSNPCLNVRTCADQVNGYSCVCKAGFSGVHCETDMDECASSPCQNEGTCTDEVNGYRCSCVHGYLHSDCQTEEIWKTKQKEFVVLRDTLNLTAITGSTGSSVLQTLVDGMRKLYNISLYLAPLDNPTTEQQTTIKDVMVLASNIVSALFRQQNYTTSDVPKTFTDTTEAREIIKMIFDIISRLVKTLLTSVQINDLPTKIDMKTFSLYSAKMTSNDLDNTTVYSQYGSVEFQVDRSVGDDCLHVMVLFCELNPFVWDQGAENVTSSTATTEVTRCGTTNITTTNSTSHAIGKRSVNSDATNLGITTVVNTIIHENPVPYEVNVPVSSTIQHYMRLSGNKNPACLSVTPANHSSLDIFIGFAVKTDTDDLYQHVVNITNDRSVSLCVTYETLAQNNATALYLLIRSNDTQACSNDPLCTAINMTYSYLLFEPECNSWDIISETWSMDSCTVSASSSTKKVRFKSNLMGSLGAGLFVAPNTINFITMFDNLGQKVVDNAAVVGTVAAILLLYVAIAVLCRILDNKDKVKWKVLQLADNDPRDNNLYEVHVYTGFKRNSGTDSQVSMILAGTDADTGIRKLHNGERKNFKTGDVSSFLVRTPFALGEPCSIKIWHDQSGQGSKRNWFLTKVVVIDITTRLWYVFLCDKWIPNEEGGFQMLHVLTKSENGHSFINNIAHSFYNYHMWLSVAYHKVCSPFTRVQRLNCCLATLFLLTVCSAMWYGTSGTVPTQVAFTIGILSVTVHQLYTSFMTTAVTMPVVVCIIMLYDNIEQTSPILQNHVAKKIKKTMQGSKGKLPHWCVYIAHFLVFCSVALSAFFTIFYAFEWGKDKSEDWLGTLVMCLLESIIFISPFMVILMALLYSFILRIDSSLIDFQTLFGKMKMGKIYKDKTHLTTAQKYEARQKSLHRQMMQMFREVFMQILLLVLVLCIVHSNQDGTVYLQNTDMNNTFTANIKNVTRVLETWDWMSKDLISNLYLTHDYNGKYVTKYDTRFTTNGYSMRFGPPSIRLIRVIPFECESKDIIDIHQCIPHYSESHTDKNSYLPGWTEKANVTFNPNDLSRYFTYQNQPNESTFWGKSTSYAPGGYVLNLGNSYSDAKKLLTQLEKNNWLDKHSRMLQIKFNVWNANTNLFNELIITFEFLSTGLVQHDININSILLYRYVGAKGLGNLLGEIIATIAMLVKTVMAVRQIHRQRRRYFQSLNNIITLAALVFFNAAVLVYVWRSILTVQTIEFMMNNRESIVNFGLLTLVNETFVTLLGISAFLLQLQLLHILRHASVISTLGATLIKSTATLLNASVLVGIASMAFITLFLIMYGSTMYEYHSFFSTGNTLVLGTLGKFRFDSLVEGSGHFGSLMFIIYIILQCSIFLNIMCTVLIDFMYAVKKGRNTKHNQVILYMKKWLRKIILPSQIPTAQEFATTSRRNNIPIVKKLDESVDALIAIAELKAENNQYDDMDNVIPGLLAFNKKQPEYVVQPLTKS